MNVLIACEFSGVVREAFRAKGHNAWSCDLLPSDDNSDFHIESDVSDYLDEGWDLMIAHPPCTYLCNSGVRWLFLPKDYSDEDETKVFKRWNDLEKATEFFNSLYNAPIRKICVENPIPHKYSKLPKHTQTIQPWQFGHDASKRTCLWLKGLPNLEPTEVITKDRYANQTPSGQNNLGPSKDRWKERSKTYQGIANAMASQWG